MTQMTNGVGGATLRIAHIPGSIPASFQVVRIKDGKTTPPAAPPSPLGFPVVGRPNSDLLRELQWYLEGFLDYPFPPETEHAERVLDALRKWGKAAFSALFQDRAASRLFDASTAEDYSALHLQIASDDPRILAWPWEALCDPEIGWVAQICQVERCLNNVRDPQPLPESLPKDRVNILMVVARPFGKKDVSFRTIARPLVELIEKNGLPAHVEMLRPPTFDRLREHLRAHPGYYHILHFDGHGANGAHPGADGNFTLQAPEGTLVFETEDARPDPIPAEKLSALLRECAVPGVVLNACQSAMVDPGSPDPFASVATALLRSGMRDVVAMAYSLYVSGAQQFLRGFYRGLFEEGNMAGAVRLGRQRMWTHDKRICARGEYPLQDWLLPVHYRQDPINFSFASEDGKKPEPRQSRLPEELRLHQDPYGFIGRDSAVLALERAMRRPPAGILIQGLGGVGKTTLVRGFLQWLDSTGGLGDGCLLLDFQGIRSAEYVFSRLGEAIFGGQFAALPIEKIVDALVEVLKERRFVIVWDNFESAAGIAGTPVTANLPEADRTLLAGFLEKLRGGACKVLITSRSTEDWLGPQRRFLLPLGGLDREEGWEYCEAILQDLGLRINRNDEKLVELMGLLRGHPLAMRAILPRLERMRAEQVLVALSTNLANLSSPGDESLNAINATLRFVEQSLPVELQPLLVLLGMHEGYVSTYFMESMAKRVDKAWTFVTIDRLMQALILAGLLRQVDVAQALFETHPLLTSYLRSRDDAFAETRVGWARAFVDVMGRFADAMTSRPLHQKRLFFHSDGQNLYRALDEAERLRMFEVGALTQSMGAFAFESRNYVEAERLYKRFAAHAIQVKDPAGEATAYDQLGTIANKQRDFVTGQEWYLKSLEIRERSGDKLGTAITRGLLGTLALQQRDFAGAEQQFLSSVSIFEKLGDERNAAVDYHHLGSIARERRDFETAKKWHLKSLATQLKHGDEGGAPPTYEELGAIAQELADFATAEKWYLKSLAIHEKQGNEYGAANNYHQLGIIAREQRDFAAAERWYLKSLAIQEKQGNDYGAASNYHELGIIARDRQDMATAEKWFLKSLAITEKSREEHMAASTYGELGSLAAMAGKHLEGGQWLLRCIVAFLKANDQHAAQRNARSFMILIGRASAVDRAKLRAMWQEAGFGTLPLENESE
jgi:tetratricopeptide (TPR) repeat protein